MEAATIETKASNDQAWNAVNHSFIYRAEQLKTRFLLVHPLFAYMEVLSKMAIFREIIENLQDFFLIQDDLTLYLIIGTRGPKFMQCKINAGRT